MPRRPGLALGAGGLVLAVLSGCSTAETATLDLPAKNRVRWVLPVDEYRWPTVDRGQIAMQLLAQKCIEEHGETWIVVTDELRAGPGESWSAANRKLFSPHLAEKYGYSNSYSSNVSTEVQE